MTTLAVLPLLGERARPIPEFIPEMYKGLDERLIPAAEMSVEAHLLDLERRGLVSSQGDRLDADSFVMQRIIRLRRLPRMHVKRNL